MDYPNRDFSSAHPPSSHGGSSHASATFPDSAAIAVPDANANYSRLGTGEPGPNTKEADSDSASIHFNDRHKLEGATSVGASAALNPASTFAPQTAKRAHRPTALPPPHPNAAALLRSSSPLSSPPLPGLAQSPASAITPSTLTPNALTSSSIAVQSRWRPSPNSTPGASVINTPMAQCFAFPDELGDPSLACDPVDMRSASEFNPRSKLVLELAALKTGADDAIRAILVTWNNNSSAFRDNPLAPQPSPLLLHIADSAIKLANNILTTSPDAVLRGSYAQDIVLSLHSWLIELRSHLSTVQARNTSARSVAETMPLYPAAEALLTQLVFIWSPIARLTQVLHDTDINFQGARLIGTSLVDVASSPVLSANPGRGRTSRPRMAESLAAVVHSARARSKSVSRSSPALFDSSSHAAHGAFTRGGDSDHSSASPSLTGTSATTSMDDIYHISDIPPLPPITAEQRRLSSVLSLPPHVPLDAESFTESDSDRPTPVDIRLSSSPAAIANPILPVHPATILRANDAPSPFHSQSPALLSAPTEPALPAVTTPSSTLASATLGSIMAEPIAAKPSPASSFDQTSISQPANLPVTPLRLNSQSDAVKPTLPSHDGSPRSTQSQTDSPPLKVPASPSLAGFFKSVRSAVADSFLSPIRSRRLSSTTLSDKRSLSPLGLTRASTHDGLSSTATGIVRPGSEASFVSSVGSDRPSPLLRPRVSSTPASPTLTRPKSHFSPSPRSRSPAGPSRDILCRICEEMIDSALLEEHTAFCKVSQQIELHLYRDDIQIRRIVGQIVKRKNDFTAAADDSQTAPVGGVSHPSELSRKRLKKLSKEADHLIKLGSRVADLDEKQPSALEKAKKCVGKLQSALDGVGNDGVHINDPLLRELTQQLATLSVDKLKNMKVYQDKVAPIERSISRRSSNSSLASSGTSLDGHESDGSPALSTTYSYRAMSLFQALLQGGTAFINATSGGPGRHGHAGISAFAGALHPALIVSTHNNKPKTSPSTSSSPTPPPKVKRDQSMSSSGSGGKRGRRGVSIEEFEFLKPISKGAFGRVYLGRKRVSGDLFAIKVLDKETMIRKNMLTHVMAERRALALANTPYVVRLYYAFMSSRHLFLEYMIGGDLSSLLAALGSFSKEMALFYTAEITAAIDYLHAASITHRDLKPDNVLIGADGHIKLTDFGLSKVAVKDQDPAFGNVDPVKSLSRFSSISRDKPDRAHHGESRRPSGDRDCLGTPDYLAVELLLGIGHGPSVDYWALGCCLFEFLTGYPPFTDESPELIFKNILNHDVQWPEEDDEGLSEDARDLIVHLLEPNPQKRFTATDIKVHPFFASIDWTHISSRTPPFIPQPDDDKDTGYFDARNAARNIDVTRFSFYEAQAVDSGTFGRIAGAATSSDVGASSISAVSSPTSEAIQSLSTTSDSDKETRRRSAMSAANQRRRSKLVDSCPAPSGSSGSASSQESPSATFAISPDGGGETVGAMDAQLEEFIAWKNVDVLGSLNNHKNTGSTTGSMPD